MSITNGQNPRVQRMAQLGKTKNPRKGFGSNPKLASEAGRRGGLTTQARRRTEQPSAQPDNKAQ